MQQTWNYKKRREQAHFNTFNNKNTRLEKGTGYKVDQNNHVKSLKMKFSGGNTEQ